MKILVFPILLLAACDGVPVLKEKPSGRVIISDIKKEVIEANSNNIDSITFFNSRSDTTLLRSRYDYWGVADSANIFNGNMVLLTEATKGDSNELRIFSSTGPDLSGVSFQVCVKDGRYTFRGGNWTDVVDLADTNKVEAWEQFPLYINKARFEVGDTVYAHAIVRYTLIEGSRSLIQYIKANIRALVRPTQ